MLDVEKVATAHADGQSELDKLWREGVAAAAKETAFTAALHESLEAIVEANKSLMVDCVPGLSKCADGLVDKLTLEVLGMRSGKKAGTFQKLFLEVSVCECCACFCAELYALLDRFRKSARRS